MSGSPHLASSPNSLSKASRRIFVLFALGFIIVLLGIIIFVAATILSGGNSANFSILVFIGPIPIVLGGGPQAALLILFSIMLAALSIIVFLLMRKRMGKTSV